MNTQRIVGIAVLGLVMASLWLKLPFAAFGDDQLFLDGPPNAVALTRDQDDAIVRQRAVRLNWEALAPDAREIRLNLFDDTALTAVRDHVDHSVIDGYVWVGRVDGMPDSLVTLSVSNGVTAGSVRFGGRERYSLSYVGTDGLGAIHRVRELDSSQLLEPSGVDTIVPPIQSDGSLQLRGTDSAACEDGSVIDVMIAYTPDAKEYVGGVDAMSALINLRVSQMNSANAASQATFEWRLVKVMETDYSPQATDSLADHLSRLSNPEDGVLDEVQPARESAKADLVNLIVASGNGGACGMAYQMLSANPAFADYAFGVTALDYEAPYSCSEFTLAHELGHNMGNAHDKAHATSTVLSDFSYGYQDPGGSFRTIMAYDCQDGCDRVNHWSNPQVQYNGSPTGIEYDQALGYGADVVRSMASVAEVVANFQSTCSVDPPATPSATPSPINTPLPTATNTSVPTETQMPTVTATALSATATSTALPSALPPTATATLSPPNPTPSPSPSATPTVPAPTATRSIRPALPYQTFVPVAIN